MNNQAIAASNPTDHTGRAAPRQPGSWLLAAGLLLAGAGGGFAPWVWRESVALQLTAPGLAEFVKFLPEVRLGQLQLERLYFLLPLFVAMLALPLVSGNRQVVLPGWLRWLLRLAVLPLALAALSPVWTPAILMAAEFRWQTGLAAAAVGLAVLAPLVGRLPRRLLAIAVAGASIAALALPLWQFSLISASLATAYNEPVGLGWGWWLTGLGLMLSLAGGVWLGIRR